MDYSEQARRDIRIRTEVTELDTFKVMRLFKELHGTTPLQEEYAREIIENHIHSIVRAIRVLIEIRSGNFDDEINDSIEFYETAAQSIDAILEQYHVKKSALLLANRHSAGDIIRAHLNPGATEVASVYCSLLNSLKGD